MENQVIIEPFQLAGIQVRTSNLDGQSAADIGKLWGDFFARDLGSKIRGKLSEEMICAYTNYASDMNGPYTVVLGYRVEPDTEQPEGVSVVEVEAGPAVVYDSVNAEPQTVLETWMKIWNADLDRAYRTDYDQYCLDGTVKTFIF